MVSWFRRRFSFGNVVLVLVLVFAMTGGAFAAKRYLITSTKQISPKVLKQLKGKRGPAGQQGPVGKEGKPGAAGKDGLPGKDGSNGSSGESVKVASAGSSECEGHGGAKFTNGTGTAVACNGQTGFTDSLPSGKTETGDWSIDGPGNGEFAFTSVSFNIPLTTPLTNVKECGTPGKSACVVHYIRAKEAVPSGCVGNIEEPGAEPGNVCVFAGYEKDVSNGFGPFVSPKVCHLGTAPSLPNTQASPNACGNSPGAENGVEGADTSGFGIVTFIESSSVAVEATGTWAVTAS